ncbi:ABC transporter permease [Vibrio spartinae]|uniref:ABC transporter permease YtrF n=1 Tax=Vibrio spartinae TaxID=1918945 RepID=A0A1N6M5W3_9VIBR|nr:FtsX-like permease family protein [Vibrio spartinae]SIO94747.1 ABC transporter permease YtrF precursor [Vibrio spartinae]
MGDIILQSIKLSALNLLRNKRRSLLSVVIITVAVFALCCAGGFGLYTYRALENETAMSIGHITLSSPSYFKQEEDTPMTNGLSNSIKLTRQLAAIKGIRAILPRIQFNGLISNGDKSTIYMGTGISPKEFVIKGEFLNIKSGSPLTDSSKAVKEVEEQQVMLGSGLAKNLKVAVGDWVTLLTTTSDGVLNAVDFKVSGIFSSGIPDLDKRQLYIPVELAKSLIATSKVSTLSVYLYRTKQTSLIREEIDKVLKRKKLVNKVITTPWQNLAIFYTKVKNLYNRIFAIMGGVMALVVFIALYSSMITSVTERTREIGTLAAIGAYPGEIIRGFLIESGILALVGSAIGGVAAAFVSYLLTICVVNMPPAPGRTQSYPLHLTFSFELFSYVAGIVMIVCLIAAWFSSRKGVKTPIIEALIHV